MTTTIIVRNPSDDEIERRHFLHPPSSEMTSPTFKPFPQSIIQSIENDRRCRLAHAHSTFDVRNINQSSIDTTDDDYETIMINSNPKRLFDVTRTQRSPSEIRITVDPDVPNEDLPIKRIGIPLSVYKNEMHNSDPSLIAIKSSRQNRVEHLRRTFLEHRFGRRIHSSFSSSTTLRSANRRRSTQNLAQRSNRRPPHNLSRNSKWHFIRNHLHDIAMMSKPYARMKLIERDLRWMHLREQILKRVLDMREMSILRQQNDGLIKSKSEKTSFDLKTIPINEVVHVERDGRVYSIGTRDLVLGRLIGTKDMQLDTFTHLDARRKFQVKQSLLRQQEGRNRLKKHIAFSFCLCNLSFIALMFATMFFSAMKIIIEIRSSPL